MVWKTNQHHSIGEIELLQTIFRWLVTSDKGLREKFSIFNCYENYKKEKICRKEKGGRDPHRGGFLFLLQLGISKGTIVIGMLSYRGED